MSLSHSLKRIVALAASTLLAVSTLVSFSLPARAATVGTGNCVATVDNASGVSVTSSGGFCFVAFKTTGITYSWTKPAHVSVIDLLVVAGGGGGAVRHAGGGGAGGLIQLTATPLTASTVSISVGAGGAGAAARSDNFGAAGTNGTNSVVSATGLTTQTAIGGGAGAQGSIGNNGGSGGGGGCCATGSSSGTSGQGNSGSQGQTGSFNSNSFWVGGAGGGAGAAATAATSSAVAGIGGAGASVSWITATAQSQLGVGVNSSGSTFFAGGGGGGTAVFGTAGGGGVGGGAAGGAVNQAGFDATANTGGGGGGGGMFTAGTSPRGGNGGSGVVVIRYAQTAMLSYNVSDINSYDASMGTAINDLSPSGALDGTLVTGSNGQSATLNAAQGALQFNGGNPNVGPYIDITPNISSTPFNTSGMTIDFEADFGSTAENWERIIDFSEGGHENDNILLGREGTTSNLILSIFHGSALNQSCIFSNAIPVNSGMNRWTVHFDGTSCRMYKNGSLVHTQAFASKPLANLTWSDNFIARSNWWQWDTSFEGLIRSVSIFEGALTPAQIQGFSYKTVTSDALAGGVSTITQTRFTSGSIKLPTPTARPGYTFTGWFTSNTFATKVGDPGAVYTPASNATLFGGWKTVDPVGNLVMNIDATNISSVPATPNNTNITSIYPGNAPMSSLSIGNVTRDTANSPGALNLTSSSPAFVSMGANNAATFGGAMTFETWFKCTAYRPGASWNIIATHWFAGPTGGAVTGSDWHFGIYNDRLQVNAGTTLGFGNYVFSSADCANNKWMLLGFSIDASSNLQIYINGQPDGALQAGKVRASTTNANLTIGDGRVDSHARGYYSRVRLYNTALTGTQVLSNFRNEATTFSLANVTYSAGPNGTGSDIIESYNSGTSVTLRNATAPFTRTGYSISGWTTSSTSGASQTNALSSATTVNADLTLYPVWSANTYTLTYAYNGATGGNSTATANFTTGGTAITLPTPTRTGFTFGGWYAEAGFTTLVSGAQSPTSSATLYAKWTQSSFTITYDYNGATGGNSTVSSSFTTGGTAITLPAPTRTGYTFGGWHAEAGLTTLVSGAQSPTADATLYAKWNVGTYTLTYTYNGATGGNSTVSSSFTTGGTAITLPSPTRTGYTFGGWYAEVGLTTLVSGAQSPTANATLFAKWNAGTYTLTYTYNGATGGNSTVSSSFTTGGTAITLPSPTRTGYNFGGWFSDVAFTNSVTGTQTPSADATLYAKWNNGIYTLTYNYNGATAGNGTAADSFTTGGTAITLPSPTRTGYTFGGWYADAGLTTLVSGAQSPTASGTLFAKWNAGTYTLTYTYNGATGGNSTATSSFTTGGTAITLPSPTRTGYTFGGWHADAGLTTVVSGAQSPTANATLFAKWDAGTYTLTYTYNGATGGNSISSASFTTGATAITLPSPTRTGYNFGGWFAEIGLTTLVSGAQSPTANATLFAKWDAGTYTLTYTYNGATGGNANATASYTTGGTAITLPTPTRTGYTFSGWFAELAFTTAVTGAQTPSANATIYAKYTAINYGLTYNSNSATSGAVPVDAANYNIGSKASVAGNSGNLARTGYSFAGWTLNSGGTGTVYNSGDSLLFGAASQVLYAKWTPNTYTITYNANGATGVQANSSDSYTTAGSAVTLSAVGTMAKTGYNFGGWSTTANGSALSGAYTTAVDVTLYAVWTIRSISVTYSKGSASSASFISFPANTASNYATRVTLSNNVDSSVTYSSQTYAFVGWSDGTSIYQAGAQYLLGASDVTFTAIWTPAYGVRYIFNGGTAANGTSAIDAECLVVGNLCTDQQVVTANAAPTRPGYTFTGWTDQSNNSIAAGSTFTVNINSYLLYAGWQAINYSVTYVPNGGNTTPTQSALRYGDTFVVAAAPTRTGYIFAGWSDGSNSFGPGANYSVGLSAITLTAQWTARTYTVSFDWNGAIGSSVANQNYTVGNTGLTLPVVTNQVKDGFQFGGWAATIGGDAVATPYIATANTTLYAIWGQGSYSVTFTPNFAAQASTVTTVANGSSTVLPTLTRSNFVFDGWYTAPTGGNKVGNGGASFTPSASRQLYARWIQSSLLGVIGNLSRISTITASDTVDSTYTGSNGGSGVSVTVPRASLPAGTVVNLDLITDNTYAQTLLTGTNNYILSLAVSWLALDETVPDTNSGTSISLTITNPSIRAGALIYSVQNGVATLLGTATANNTLTVQLTADPSIYVVSTVPSLPRAITSTVTSNSATLTWTAPVSDGGATISGYTMTLNTGAVCTTLTLTCTFNNLTAGTTYTATIVATNTVGSSVSATSSFTLTTPVVVPPVVVPPIVVPPVVVPPVVVPPVVPPAIVVIPVVTAVEKVLANNVPVLTGTRVVTPVIFNADSAKLDSTDMAQIRRAAAALEGKTGWLLITGFVKYTGKMTPKIRALASSRAKNVANAFLRMGVKVQIGYLGYGPKNTRSPQNNDRKVEIRWIDKPTLNG